MVREMATTVPATEAMQVEGHDLRVSYKRQLVLDVPEIHIRAGTTYALLGTSGAGKSTLLRVLGLLEPPSAGTVLHDGRTISHSDLQARRRIAAVFQKPYLLRGTVGNNVEYGLKLRRVPSAERRQRVSAALALVGLEGWEQRSALQLSGGEAQRVALARALVLKPSFLLLDEPLSYLDPLLKRELTREFAHVLSSEHVTALYVTHDQDEASVVADNIGIMNKGVLVSQGDAKTVMTLPEDEWVAGFLGAEVPLRGEVTEAQEGLVTIASGGCEIQAVAGFTPGDQVLFGVRPEDVLLMEPGAHVPSSTVQNQLDARVASIVPTGLNARVVVETAGCRFAASASQSWCSSLGLDTGSAVTVLFKAAAVHARAL